MAAHSADCGIPKSAAIKLDPAVLWLRTADGATGYCCDRSGPLQPLKIDSEQLVAIERLAGGTTMAVLRRDTKLDQGALEHLLAKLDSWGGGALKWQDGDNVRALKDHRRNIELLRLRDIHAAMSAKAGDNEHFHERELGNAHAQFDLIETTISHAFRLAHPALGDRSYGEAFCDWLVEGDRIRSGCRLIEIGCGLGYFANAILDRLATRWPDIYGSLTYTLFDLSPELQAAQKEQCARHHDRLRFLQGNIENYQFGDERFDLVISNEVIADLSVANVSISNLENQSPETEAERLAVDFQLNCVPVKLGGKSVAILNVGAIRMLQNIAGCMAKGGQAVITEYGTFGQSPKAVHFSNHKEFTVDFGHLGQVADALGLCSELDTMGNAIGFDPRVETIRWEALRTLSDCLLPDLGLASVQTLAFWPKALKQALGSTYDRIGNIEFLSLDHPDSFSPFRFELMSLVKP